MSDSEKFSHVDWFDCSKDEFTRKEYMVLEKEMARAMRVDGPGSLEPTSQTLMRMVLQARAENKRLQAHCREHHTPKGVAT